MFAEERIQAILNILKKEGRVTVKELSSKFNVTEDCIRKDLKNIEKISSIRRIYGGAVLARETLENQDTKDRKEINIPTKKIIAEKAFNLIADRETIFLDISTINILLAKLLAESNKKVTLVTNMLDILNVVTSKPNNLNIISTGGLLNLSLDGFVGTPTIEFISKYKFDKTFMGSCGVDVFNSSLTTFEIEDGLTKKAIINSSKKVFIVMEDKKFKFDGNFKFAHLEDISSIITEKTPTPDIVDTLSEFNINIL
ncbi:TPA: DeoR/GlpR family DNA-binding transcription regulator [Clostridioides difficile]|nr:DeoR faimly transcriptional regulator [Clostridioides difficile]